MPLRKARSRPPSSSRLSALDVLHPDAAGIDIGSDFHVVAVTSPDGQSVEVRSFGACTADLVALADWLVQHSVKTVAMESTGVYWIPLYDLLESRGFSVLLVDPRQIQRAPGRPKTDTHDAQWIRRLHSLGLLSAAFRPEESIRVLRCYLRQRANLVRYAGQHIQHMQKALEQMNVKLTETVSDITGKTGMNIIKAILNGQRDPAALAALRDPRCKQDAEQIARALQGSWRAEHLFELKQAVELYEFYHRQIDACDRQIEEHLKGLQDANAGDPPAPKKVRPKRKTNSPRFDARGQLYRVAGVDLTAIEGIEEATALVLISEIGTDMRKWPSSKQFCSWLGLCPQVKQSAGKVLSSKVRAGPNRAAQALRMAANSLQSSKSALGAFFRRIAARAGRAKAVTATAHKLGRLVYALLKHGQEYVAKGQQEYEEHYRERMVRSLTRKAEELGYELKAKEASQA
ncbi:MAG: IS110 family transposase [Thermomicrobiales bacterium]